MNSFYSYNELISMGIKSIGKDVKISRKTSIYNPDELEIGDNTRVDDFVILSGNIKIGCYVHISPFCALFGRKGIYISDFVSISSRVSIYTESDDYIMGISLANPTIPAKYRKIYDAGSVELKKHSIIGANSIIMPDVIIDVGTSIGAFSFLRDDTEKWTIYTGIPAKKIGNRESETILQLEKKLRKELLVTRKDEK